MSADQFSDPRDPTEPRLVGFPVEGAWRVARESDPLSFSEITATDATRKHAGNRFDVEGGGVLYAATLMEGCYGETLARFRPSPAVQRAVEEAREANDGFMVCGGVPADWRANRIKVRVTIENPLPFVDVDDPATHAFLTRVMAAELEALGVPHLDRALVMGPNRALTRTIATWLHMAEDDEGNPLYGGIRYESRLGDWECWGIFDGNEIVRAEIGTINLSDEDLQKVATAYGLRPF